MGGLPLELHMLDLMPPSAIAALRERFGAKFDEVGSLGRTVLATAMIEGIVTHARMVEISSEHPHDLSMVLARLERDGLLHSQGQSRGKVYFLPGFTPLSPEQVFTQPVTTGASFSNNGISSSSNGSSSGSNEQGIESTVSTGHIRRDMDGCWLSPLLDAPIVDDLEALSPALQQELLQRCAAARSKKRLDRNSMIGVILAVCEGRYVRLSVLAKLLQRDADGLRRGYIDKLVKTNHICRAFPGSPNHEKQSYR